MLAVGRKSSKWCHTVRLSSSSSFLLVARPDAVLPLSCSTVSTSAPSRAPSRSAPSSPSTSSASRSRSCRAARTTRAFGDASRAATSATLRCCSPMGRTARCEKARCVDSLFALLSCLRSSGSLTLGRLPSCTGTSCAPLVYPLHAHAAVALRHLPRGHRDDQALHARDHGHRQGRRLARRARRALLLVQTGTVSEKEGAPPRREGGRGGWLGRSAAARAGGGTARCTQG